MLNYAVFKQDFMINRKHLLFCGILQLLSLILAAAIRTMRLIDISDIFFDTLPVLIIPGLMQILLVYGTVREQEQERTMQFVMATGISPANIMSTKILFMILMTLVLFALSAVFGCATHLYDLTGEWTANTYLFLNLGGIAVNLFVGGWCFLIACIKEKAKPSFYWKAAAGVILLFYLFYLIYYIFPEAFFLKFITMFSLFVQSEFAKGSLVMVLSSVGFAVVGIAFYFLAKSIFCKRSFRE